MQFCFHGLRFRFQISVCLFENCTIGTTRTCTVSTDLEINVLFRKTVSEAGSETESLSDACSENGSETESLSDAFSEADPKQILLRIKSRQTHPKQNLFLIRFGKMHPNEIMFRRPLSEMYFVFGSVVVNRY